MQTRWRLEPLVVDLAGGGNRDGYGEPTLEDSKGAAEATLVPQVERRVIGILLGRGASVLS